MRCLMPINPRLVQLSRKLRHDQTPWEKRLWAHLRGRRFAGSKFRRQFVLGPYVFDFCCFERRVLIELDGSQHLLSEQVQSDAKKQEYAEAHGYRVLRFYNSDVERNMEGVLLVIQQGIVR